MLVLHPTGTTSLSSIVQWRLEFFFCNRFWTFWILVYFIFFQFSNFNNRPNRTQKAANSRPHLDNLTNQNLHASCKHSWLNIIKTSKKGTNLVIFIVSLRFQRRATELERFHFSSLTFCAPTKRDSPSKDELIHE